VRDQTGQIDNSKLATRQQGFGGSAQVVLDPYVELGGNFEYATQSQRDDAGLILATGTFHQYTAGGFVNARLFENAMIGAGFHYSFREDTNYDMTLKRDSNANHAQAFGALQYRVVDQLFVKLVGAYARADVNPIRLVNPTVYRNETLSGRLRLMYLF
jgi:hypothetical protein